MVPVREGPGGALTDQQRGCDVDACLFRRDANEHFKRDAVRRLPPLIAQRDGDGRLLLGCRRGPIEPRRKP
jgi:hypothetical protein